MCVAVCTKLHKLSEMGGHKKKHFSPSDFLRKLNSFVENFVFARFHARQNVNRRTKKNLAGGGDIFWREPTAMF